LDPKFVDEIKAKMPPTVSYIRNKLNTLEVNDSAVDTLLNELKVGNFMLKIVDKYDATIVKKIANWLSSDVQGYVADRIFSWDKIHLNEKSMVELARLVTDKIISSTSAKLILKEMLLSNDEPMDIANKLKLVQVSGSDDLLPLIKRVILDNPNAVSDLKSGEDKAIGFLIGQIMKSSQGKADPGRSKELIKHELGL
jgi:aspartyl-tRNA(Asn)/glutamyl-tRNA(Gln) amidotransferase subunit B